MSFSGSLSELTSRSDNDENTQITKQNNPSSVPSLKALSSVASSSSTISSGLAGMALASSDPSFYKSLRRNAEFPSANATLCIAQRSGAGDIRSIISSMENCLPCQDKISSKEECSRNSAHSSSSEEASACRAQPLDCDVGLHIAGCTALATWARDPYYRVLISASGGIPVILRVMLAFPLCADLQSAGCSSLASLSRGNGSNQRTIQIEGGLSVVAAALRNHPSSITVQSSACDALRQLTSIVYTNIEDLAKENEDIIHLMEQALTRLLPNQSRESAEMVLQLLKKRS